MGTRFRYTYGTDSIIQAGLVFALARSQSTLYLIGRFAKLDGLEEVPSSTRLRRVKRAMDEHSGNHNHAEFFDEVIKRGFPANELGSEWKQYKLKLPPHNLGLQPRRVRLSGVVTNVRTIRKNQQVMLPSEQEAFKNAISRMVADGTYRTLIDHHMEMSHNMHGSMGFVGLLRFLAWHRRYLLEFEIELNKADRMLRPTNTVPLGVPYWNWPDPFPQWLNGFLPAKDPVSGANPPARKNAPPPQIADAADIQHLLTAFETQLPGENVNSYVKFTYGLEGWGVCPNGTPLPAHNQGHAWIGGIMNNTSTSPTDPMFWLHHCQIDRLWQIWHLANTDQHPPLAGIDRIMDPWTDSYDDLIDTVALGYHYDTSTP